MRCIPHGFGENLKIILRVTSWCGQFGPLGHDWQGLQRGTLSVAVSENP